MCHHLNTFMVFSKLSLLPVDPFTKLSLLPVDPFTLMERLLWDEACLRSPCVLVFPERGICFPCP